METNNSSATQQAPASVAASGKQTVKQTGKKTRTLWQRMASPVYLFTKAPWTAFASLVLIALISLVVFSGTSTLILLLALPALAVPFGVFERKRLAQMGYPNLKDGHVKLNNPGAFEWIKFRYTEPATWREVGSLLATSIIGAVAGAVLLVEMSVLVILVALSIALLRGEELVNWGLYTSHGRFDDDFWFGPATNAGNARELLHMPDITSNMWWIFLLAIIPALLIFAYINGIIAATQASASNAILAPRPQEYERQVARLSESRTKIVDAFETERRRIERDLHDGVQQELVNINMRLGLAEMEAKKLPETAPVLTHVTEARTQLAHAQQTLRNTVRGIYPAVLEDHGLKAALEELAHGCAVPVHLTYYANGRMAPEIERTAYFAASEAITNVLKHANAKNIQMDVREANGYLQLTVQDDGIGGANPNTGTGLAGLYERAQALGGSFTVESAPGNTLVQMKLPIS